MNKHKLIKICGITNADDALFCFRLGADILGFVAYAGSPRFIGSEAVSSIIARCRDFFPFAKFAGVFVSPTMELIKEYISCGIDILQIHSHDFSRVDHLAIVDRFPSLDIWISFNSHSPQPKSFIVPPAAIHYDSFDPKSIGGTGRLSDWGEALILKEQIGLPFVLAGGLNQVNVANAIKAVCPDGVDVSSGVEISAGVKDRKKLELFIKNAREAFNNINSST